MSIDVGIPQLAMHSSIETCSTKDVYELYKMMHKFYESNIKIRKGNYINELTGRHPIILPIVLDIKK